MEVGYRQRSSSSDDRTAASGNRGLSILPDTSCYVLVAILLGSGKNVVAGGTHGKQSMHESIGDRFGKNLVFGLDNLDCLSNLAEMIVDNGLRFVGSVFNSILNLIIDLYGKVCDWVVKVHPPNLDRGSPIEKLHFESQPSLNRSQRPLLGVCIVREAPERANESDRRAGKWGLRICGGLYLRRT